MATAHECFDDAMGLLRPTIGTNVAHAALYDIASGLHNLTTQISEMEKKQDYAFEQLLRQR